MIEDALRAGIAAARAGNVKDAQVLLAKAVRENPKSEQAWFWLGTVLTEPERREYCFRRVLALNPDHVQAKERLESEFPPKPAWLIGQNEEPSIIAPPRSTRTSEPPTPRVEARSAIMESKPADIPSPREPTPNAASTAADSNAPTAVEKMLVVVLGLIIGLLVCGALPYFLIQTGRLDTALRIATTTPIPPTDAPTPSSTPTPPATNTLVLRPSTLTPTPTLSKEQSIALANDLMAQGKHAEAISVLDHLIAVGTNDGTIYYKRASCYQKLMENQRSLEEFQDYNRRALADLDKAIALGSAMGDFFYARGDVYANWASIQTYRVDRDRLLEIALENDRMGAAMGGSDPLSDTTVPTSLYYLGKCDEELAETQRLPNPTESGFNTLLALGHLCQGEFDQALQQIDTAIKINPNNVRKFDRSIILYNMGRLNDALAQLNEIIDASPRYNGYRYYLRALVYYDLKKPDLAREDLITGSGNTWGRGGLMAYVQGRLLIDAGNKTDGIEQIRFAEATLSHEYGPLLDRIRKEIVQLGVVPLAPTPSVHVSSTPIPMPKATATAPSSSNVKTAVPTPSNATTVDLAVGTGKLTFQPNDYPVLRFQSSAPLQFKTIQSLTFRLLSANSSGTTPLQLYLWNPANGGWGMVNLKWGDNAIASPENYVAPSEILVAIRNPSQQTIVVENAGFMLTVVRTDGSKAVYGLK